MKKNLFMMLCLLMVGVSGVKAQGAKIILQHGDESTICSSLKGAYEAAVDGDVIYLNEGAFDGQLNDFSKDISIIGAGAGKSVLLDPITFTRTTKPNYTVFDGVTITSIEQPDRVEDVSRPQLGRFIKCIIKRIHIGYRAALENGYFDNCDIYSYSSYGRWYMLVGTFVNCKVSLDDYSPQGNFYYCNVRANILDVIGHTYFYNCIIDGIFDVIILKNCLYSGELPSSVYVDNAWKYEEGGLLTEDRDCALTNDELKGKGYVDEDGRVIGANGGLSPFSLDINRPYVSEFSADVDATTRKMTVNLKVTTK